MYANVQDPQLRRHLQRRLWFRVLIPLVIVLAIGAGMIGYGMWIGRTLNKFRGEVNLHLITVNEEYPLVARYLDETSEVSGENLRRIAWALTLSQMRTVHFMPEIDESQLIRMDTPTGAEFHVAPAAADAETTIIDYRYDGRRRLFKIEGYKVHDWIRRAISLEGIYNPNVTSTEAGEDVSSP